MPLIFASKYWTFLLGKSNFGKSRNVDWTQIKDIYLICINYWMSDSESSVEVEEKHEL